LEGAVKFSTIRIKDFQFPIKKPVKIVFASLGLCIQDEVSGWKHDSNLKSKP